jgi:hypothetical protein
VKTKPLNITETERNALVAVLDKVSTKGWGLDEPVGIAGKIYIQSIIKKLRQLTYEGGK